MTPEAKGVVAGQITFGMMCFLAAGLGLWMNVTLPWWGLMAVYGLAAIPAVAVGRAVQAAHSDWER